MTKLPEVKLVRQEADSFMCTAACCAMLTGKSILELVAEYGYDTLPENGCTWWSMSRAYSALALNSWHPMSFTFSNEVVPALEWLTECVVNLPECFGLLGVQSEKIKLSDGTPASHSVVWHPDGYILDPGSDEQRALREFVITEWTPLVFITPYEGPLL